MWQKWIIDKTNLDWWCGRLFRVSWDFWDGNYLMRRVQSQFSFRIKIAIKHQHWEPPSIKNINQFFNDTSSCWAEGGAGAMRWEIWPFLFPSAVHYFMKYLSPAKFQSVQHLNHAVVKFVGPRVGVHVCVRLKKDVSLSKGGCLQKADMLLVLIHHFEFFLRRLLSRFRLM